MTGSTQRSIRRIVLETLYESESSAHDPATVLERRLAHATEEDAAIGEGKTQRRAARMLDGVLNRRDDSDQFISAAAPKYDLDAMAIVDRNILRLAIWELLSDNSAPVAAVVNEAVELAHRYGGESSPAFVNGVLRTVSQRISASRVAEPAAIQEETPNLTIQESLPVATVFERVRAIVVEQLGVEDDEVIPTASFVEDLNADSLDLVELIMSLEEEFSGDAGELEISDEDAEKIATVQDAVDYLRDHGIEDK